jgi:hypothetical protein
VHIPKVAGQSIDAVLMSVAITADGTRRDMGLGKRGGGGPGPERLGHLTGPEYRELGFVSGEEFRTFFKFAFVRNPWDRAYSMYRHFGLDEYMSFEYFLAHVLKREMWKNRYWFVRPQCDFVLDAHGELCVDFLGRFETLEQDFGQVADVLGLKTRTLPYLNPAGSRWRVKKLRALRRYPRALMHWRGLVGARPGNDGKRYSAEASGLIEEMYGSDVVQFGYDTGKYQFTSVPGA